jgi:hypothetical protein
MRRCRKSRWVSYSEDLRKWSLTYGAFQQEIVAKCERWATSIQLYSKVCPSKRHSSEIQSALEEGLFCMERLSPADGIQTCFLLLTFIFDVAGFKKFRCQAIKPALEAHNSWSALGNVNDSQGTFLTQKYNGAQELTDY